MKKMILSALTGALCMFLVILVLAAHTAKKETEPAQYTHWYLYSIQDLAGAYRMSESKVMSLLHRMRSKLKLHLEKEGISL